MAVSTGLPDDSIGIYCRAGSIEGLQHFYIHNPLLFGQAADFDLASGIVAIDINNQATVNVRLQLAAGRLDNCQFPDIFRIGNISTVNVAAIESFIRPDDQIAGDGRIILAGGIAANGKDLDVIDIRDIGPENVTLSFPDDNILRYVHYIVKVFRVCLIGIRISSADIAGDCEIGGIFQVCNVGAADTVRHVKVFVLVVLVDIEMFQPDDLVAGDRRMAVRCRVAVLP